MTGALAAATIAWLALAAEPPAAEAAPPPTEDSDGEEEGFDFGGPPDSGEDDDDGDEGFGFGGPDDPTGAPDRTPEATPEEEEPSPWSMSGFLRSDWALWAERFDANPFASGRQSLDLSLRFHEGLVRLVWAAHAEYDFAYLHERDTYDEPTLRAYEYQLDPREVLIGLSPWHFELTVGRQIVGWGEGEMLSPLDVVNPRDFREPGLTDLEDVRLPVFATRLGFFYEGHRVEAMVVHEAFFGHRPPPLAPMSPIPSLLDAVSIPGQPPIASLFAGKEVRWRDLQDSVHAELQQFLLRWTWKGPGVDLGLYGGSVLDREGVVVLPDPAAISNLAKVFLFVDHKRYWLVGHSGNVPLGSFLLRWELAADLGRHYNVDASDEWTPRLGAEGGSMVHAMVSLRFDGLTDAAFVLELQKGFFLEEPEHVLLPADALAMAFRARYDFLRGDLRLSVATVLFGYKVQYGWVLRGDVRYRILDDLAVTLGYITYQPGTELSLLSGLDTHDRLYLGVRWDFTLF